MRYLIRTLIWLGGGALLGLFGLTAVRRRTLRATKVADNGNGPRPHIVVAGAGFAGVRVVGGLAKLVEQGLAEVTLLDRQNYHLFTPLLYQVATGAIEPVNIAYPLRPFTARRGVRLVTATVTNINLIEQTVETDEGRIVYDYLVLSLGSQTNYFGMHDVEERSHAMKSIRTAVAVRRDIIASVEDASATEDATERQRLMTFVVVGAGATGVELVGSIHDFVHNNLLPHYPTLSGNDVRIILIEATDIILPGVDERLREITRRRLEQIGVDLRLKTAVSGIEDGEVVTRGGDRIPARTIIWAAGIRPTAVTASLPVEKSRDGRLIVDDHLRLPAHPNVFAVGDNAYAVAQPGDKPLPPNAAVAVRQGDFVAKSLVHLVQREPLFAFHYRSLGELIALGRGHAAAEIGPVVFSGLPAWFVWRVYYLTRLMGMKNRAGVAVNWIAALFSQRSIVDIET